MQTKLQKPVSHKQRNSTFFASENSSSFFQAKGELQTSEPGDSSEKEAEKMAELASGTLGLEDENMVLEGLGACRTSFSQN